MFDNPVDITKIYGATFIQKPEKGIKPHKTPKPKESSKRILQDKSLTKQVRAEYLEMRKTDEFWVWWKRQYARQHAECYYCEVSLKNRRVNVEHITPISRGGQNVEKNMVLSCASCNMKKGTKLIPKKKRAKLKLKLDLQIKKDNAYWSKNAERIMAEKERQDEVSSYWLSNL